ncbi:MAG: phosphatidate cytidylyltransferase [Candidatus Eisenbacteria bacterium]|nr:phosphatidate cytidylyltransferase [Candidatus Eisenbacteria bacterium]
MIAQVTLATAILFAAGAGLMTLAERARHADAARVRADWIKYGVYVLVIAAMLGAGAWDRRVAAALLAAVAIGGALELRGNLAGRVRRPDALAALFCAVACGSLAHLVIGPAANSGVTAGVIGEAKMGAPWFPAYALAILLVATTDSFSQLWGRLLGRHRLCPKLSPGKTREGLAGGLGTAVIVALAMGFLAPGLAPWARVALGLATAAGAVAGDLAFSWIKRQLGIKDFSSSLPGHGGLLDRFDSLLVAAPVYTWTRWLLAGS